MLKHPTTLTPYGGINMIIYSKICTKCKTEKPLSEFYKHAGKKCGHRAQCKQCTPRYKTKPKQIYSKDKTCAKCGIKKSLIEFPKDKYGKDGRRPRCILCHSIYTKSRQSVTHSYYKKYYEDNKESASEYNKKYRENNSEKEKERSKEWRENNPEKVKEIQKKYQSNRRKNDPLFKLSCNIRALIYDSIKKGGFTKRSKTYKILGCSFDEFKIHIESQFTEGMSWDNHGEWHFDHITPISWAETEEEIIALNNYINFQPLWAEDNLKKGNRFSGRS